MRSLRPSKILELHRQGGITPVVAVDEAHLRDTDVLEDIRFLTNYGVDAASPLALIVCGPPQLRESLRFRRDAVIRQRVRHHMGVAGADPDIFIETGVDAIHTNTGGDATRAAPLDAYIGDKTVIEENTVERVVADFPNDADISG